MRECNLIVEYAIFYIHMLHLFSPDSSWDDAVVVTISDASFCQEQEQIDGITENFKSQQACITALARGDVLNAERMRKHPLSWSSTRIRSVCRSTLVAEAHAPPNAAEQGLQTRAAIVDMQHSPICVSGRKQLPQQCDTSGLRSVKVFCSFGFSQYQTS